MYGDGFFDDEVIGDEFVDCLVGVGVGDFVDFVGVELNFVLIVV